MSLPRAFVRTAQCLSLSICLSLALAARVTAAEVVGSWNFDEVSGELVKDAGGGGRDGKVTGAQAAEGKTGKSLEFKGPDYSGPFKPPGTFVLVTGSEKLNPAKTVEVSAAIYPTSYPVAWGGIVEKGVGYGSSFRIVILRNGHVRAAIGNEHLTVDSPEKIALNAWTRVKMSFDGKTLKLFLDDKPAGSVAAVSKSLASTSPIEFGRRFTGRIDDVKISY